MIDPNQISNKQLLDSELGLNGKSLNDFLNGLSTEDTVTKFHDVDSAIKTTVGRLDGELERISSDPSLPAKFEKVEGLFSNIQDLIGVSKDMIRHVYENIVSTDLIDARLVTAAAQFIKECRASVESYLTLYQDRLKFFDKIRLMQLEQEQKKELLEMRFRHEREMFGKGTININDADSSSNGGDGNSKPVEVGEGSMSFDQEAVIKMLDGDDDDNDDGGAAAAAEQRQ